MVEVGCGEGGMRMWQRQNVGCGELANRINRDRCGYVRVLSGRMPHTATVNSLAGAPHPTATMLKRDIKKIPNPALGIYFSCLLLTLWLPAASWAKAADPLEQWRAAITETRTLAENDAPAAYRSALRLQTKLPAAATTADQVKLLNLFARIELHQGLIAESAKHSATAHELAKQDNDASGQVEADLNISLAAINQGRLDDMITATQEGMNLLESIQRDDLRAEEMFQGAMMYLRFGQLDEAVGVAMQAMEVANNSGNPLVHAYAEQGMAVTYDQSGNYEESGKHYSNMLEAARQAHCSLMEAAAILGQGTVSSDKGEVQESERLIRQAMSLFQHAGAPLYVNHARHILADLFRRGKQPGKALALVNENAASYAQDENPIGLWWTLQMRSMILQGMGRLPEAYRDAKQSYALAQQIGFNIYLGDSAKRLSEVAAAQGDIKQAYRWSAEAIGLKEKSDREKSGKRVAQLAKRYREESKQRQIDALLRKNELQDAQQRWLWALLGGSLAVLGLGMYFLLRLRRSSEQIRALNTGLEQRVQERTAELSESSQSLAEAQRIAHVGSWEMNLVDNILSWSDEIYRIFEIDPQQFGASYEAFMELVHPDDREWLDRTYKESLEKHQPFEIDHRLLLPDGRIKYVHECCETVYDDNGRPLRSIGTVHDISERKLLEAAMLESEARYRNNYHLLQSIIESPSASVTIYAIDREYRLLAFNSRFKEAAKRLWNADIELGMSMLDAIDTEAHREFFRQGALPVLAGNHGFLESVAERFEDGKRVVEYHDNYGSPIYNDAGNVIGMTIFVLNTSERKRMEGEVLLREQLFRTLAENAPDNIIRYDEDGRILYANPNMEKLFGMKLSELAGKTPSETFPDGRYDEIEATVRQVIATGLPTDYLFPVPDSGGTQHHHLRFTPECDAQGKVRSVLLIGRDVTALRRLEAAREAALAEAERLAKMRSEFIAHMSHELRTPLNAILGYAQVLERSRKLEEKQQTEVELIHRSGEHLLALIEDILDISRIESGRLRLDEGGIPLESFLSTIVGIVAIRARQKPLAFICEFAPDLPLGIRGDEKRLRQVLLNLLGNAVKFTDRGKVVFSVRRSAASRLAFTVSDTGIGIAPTKLETIFTPFEQVSDARHRSGGAGLGLAISRQLVRLMGGEITVESREGEGSIFRFELELPDAVIDQEQEQRPEADMSGAVPEDVTLTAERLLIPPSEVMQKLHRLALLGNMRDISNYAGHIATLDLRYEPFAAHLKQLAKNYQSQAILKFVEGYLS